MEIIAPGVVIIVCALLAMLLLQFAGNQDERRLLTRLFFTAFVVRIVFTVACYSLGVIDLLGGADDTAWTGMWWRSQHWKTAGIPPLATIFDMAKSQSNPGFSYYGSLFFYMLGMRSQEALSCFNCFLNALTVIIIFKTAREFFSEKASAFVAWAAIFMPTFLIWSALTVKETWLILLEIATCFFLLLFVRRRGSVRIVFFILPLLCIPIAFSLRYYVAWFLLPGAIIVFSCAHSPRPFRAAGLGCVTIIFLAFVLQSLRVVQFDLAHLAQARLAEIAFFRQNISDASQAGTNSAVVLDYDLHTPTGSFMMMLVGGAYLLLSPFPWHMTNVRQLMALPDMLLWWVLVAGFILPGLRYAWRQRPAILLSVFAFVLPLTIFYSLMFGNIGLAYRQRAQLMPFFLVLAAAGYESRHRQRHGLKREQKARIATLLLLRLRETSGASRPSL